MSLGSEAKELAISTVTKVLAGFWPTVDRAIAMRWAEADVLALEAEYMVKFLSEDPGLVFARKMRIAHWRRRQRRFSARAWAKDPKFAALCKICHPLSIPEES